MVMSIPVVAELGQSHGLSNCLELLRCPACHEGLSIAGRGLACAGCARRFELEGGIPRLFWPNEWPSSRRDVTETVRAFYEATPFPNYDEVDSIQRLRVKAE